MVEELGAMVKVAKASTIPTQLRDDLLQNWCLLRLEGKEFWSAYREAKKLTLRQYERSPLLLHEPMPHDLLRGDREEDPGDPSLAATLVAYTAKMALPKERELILSSLEKVRRGEGIAKKDIERLRQIFSRVIAALMMK